MTVSIKSMLNSETLRDSNLVMTGRHVYKVTNSIMIEANMVDVISRGVTQDSTALKSKPT